MIPSAPPAELALPVKPGYSRRRPRQRAHPAPTNSRAIRIVSSTRNLNRRQMDRGLRLWRARRRHDRIDASFAGPDRTGSSSTGERPSVGDPPVRDRNESTRGGRGELEELQRAGWIDHW
jgi:hypothetical protein